jgi:hypothetical protein
MQYLRVIARAPHPAGSKGNAEVRDYLLAQFGKLGLSDIVYTKANASIGEGPSIPLFSVAARLPGAKPSGRKAVLLVAHHDAVPGSFGAGDDGAAVTALLETLRALKAGPPLKQDVIVLFTDGEELGMLGAQTFLSHPWMKDVGLVLNFEGRGIRGPVFMFETSDQNGWLIRHLARAVPHPLASSLSRTVYKSLPNDTDLSRFLRAGFSGMNFGFIDGLTYYHSPNDRLDNLDERSLQHHGSYALALARHFGNLDDLTDPRKPDVIYFYVPGLFVIYPGSWVVPLTLAAVLTMVFVIALGLRRGRLTWMGLAVGAGVALAALITAPLATMGAWWLVRAIKPSLTWASHSGLFASGFVALSLATTSILYAPLWRRFASAELALGALFWWLALAVASAFWLPGASYAVVWPLLFGLLVPLAITIGFREDSAVATIAAYLAPLPALLILAPTIQALYATLLLTVPVALIAPTALVLLALVPLLRNAAAPARWALPVLALLVALGLMTAGLVLPADPIAVEGVKGKGYYEPGLPAR